MPGKQDSIRSSLADQDYPRPNFVDREAFDHRVVPFMLFDLEIERLRTTLDEMALDLRSTRQPLKEGEEAVLTLSQEQLDMLVKALHSMYYIENELAAGKMTKLQARLINVMRRERFTVWAVLNAAADFELVP